MLVYRDFLLVTTLVARQHNQHTMHPQRVQTAKQRACALPSTPTLPCMPCKHWFTGPFLFLSNWHTPPTSHALTTPPHHQTIKPTTTLTSHHPHTPTYAFKMSVYRGISTSWSSDKIHNQHSTHLQQAQMAKPMTTRSHYNIPLRVPTSTTTPRPYKCQIMQCAHWHFGQQSATIRCKYALNFDGVYLQGVYWDSLESLELLAGVQLGDTLVLHTALAIILYVLYGCYIHNIYWFL